MKWWKGAGLAGLAAALAATGGGLPERALGLDVGPILNVSNGHSYQFFPVTPNATWAECKVAAEARGGYLATITSWDEQKWIVDTLDTAQFPGNAWIGATDEETEGDWKWITGEPWNWSNWATRQPDNAGGGSGAGEDYGEIYRNGFWNDRNAASTLRGYIVEWDGEVPPVPPVPPPGAPFHLAAAIEGGGVALTWTDGSTDEDGFAIERMPQGYSFSHLESTPPDTQRYTDRLLLASTTYTYRVRAYNAGGESEYTNEISITTPANLAPPNPPKAPSQLEATLLDTTTVDLSWKDNSSDETRFDVERAVAGGPFTRFRLEKSDATFTTDTTLRAGWPYSYRVRALSLQGPSGYASPVSVEVPATFELPAVIGTYRNSTKPKKDTLAFTLTYAAPAEPARFDPVADGLELQLGPANAPVTVSIPPGAVWKKTKSTSTWRTAKGVSPVVTVTVNAKRSRITVNVSALDFAGGVVVPQVAALVASGGLSGAHLATWTERKGGVFAPK